MHMEQILLLDALVDQPDLDRLLGGEAARTKDHLARQPLADDARQVLGRPDRRAGADARASLAKHRVVGGDDEVAP